MPETINEKFIFTLSPAKVKISDDLPRHRKELGKIKDMVTSIQTLGQIQPIVINRNNILIAGGRRLAACLLMGRDVRACYRDTVDPLLMRELELEENVQRKALTPAEEAIAIADLIDIKQKRHGVPTQGRKGGFTLNDAATMTGKTKGSIIDDIKIAEAVRMFPNLAACKTKSDIKKAVKTIERTNNQMEALTSYESVVNRTDKVILVNKLAEDYVKTIPSDSIDLFFTDPPYGIGIDKTGYTLGGETGGEMSQYATYTDDEEESKDLMIYLARESFRITKDTAHAFIFCAPGNFWWLSEQMASHGWLVAPRPLIWAKPVSHHNNQPERWFTTSYEFILFARKDASRFVLPGKSELLYCDKVPTAERTHQAEKPVALCKELISRVCLPAQYMIDPCMGSGALIAAGYQMKLLVMGCEKTTEIYASAMARMAKLQGDK